MAQDQGKLSSVTEPVDDDEPDEWDKRIFSTGCADENMKMTDCYFEKKDWRACAAELPSSSPPPPPATHLQTVSTPTPPGHSPAQHRRRRRLSPTPPDPVTCAQTSPHETMMLSRRAASAAARVLAPRAPSLPLAARFYATEAATPAAQPSPTPAAASKPAPVASKWAKAKTAAKPARSASTSSSISSSLTEADVIYEPRTIAYQAEGSQPPVDAASIPAVDWANSFHGISSRPVTEEQFRALMAPLAIKDIEVKPDGVVYLPEIKYRRRLNEAFGPMGWGMIPKGDAVVGNSIVTREYALIVDGRFVSQAQGENAYFSPDQLPSSVEGCKSNALMRCCKDLGIGSELWDPHFLRWFKRTHMEQAWVEHATTKKRKAFWFKKGEVQVSYPYSLAK
ncbi:mgm101, partial [Metarhizium hybridum]